MRAHLISLSKWLLQGLSLTAGVSLAASPLWAQSYYAGKKVDLILGAAPGGGYDTYARMIARYMPRHMPDNPGFVMRYMPGAGSAIAARHVYSVAPSDGLTIVALAPGAVMGKLINDKEAALFDSTRFIYLGSADSSVRVCITYKSSTVKTYEDTFIRSAIFGATGPGSGSRDYAALHTHVSGSKFKIVSGYKGTAEQFLAMERGELDGVCGLGMSALASIRPDWIRDNMINILVQDSVVEDADLTRRGVPHVMTFIKDLTDRKAVQLVISQSAFSKPYAVAPGTPTDRVNVMRNAFMKTLADKELLAEADKLNVVIAPLSGERLQDLVQEIHASSTDVIRRARQIVEP